jgi:Flp pilus assembly pilin Flp
LFRKVARLIAYVQNEQGQALVEYAFILMLVATVTVAALTAIGAEVPGPIQEVADVLT